MEVIISKGFIKDLKGLPKNIIQDVDEVINIIATCKNLQSSGLDYKKISGQKRTENYYRIRLGNYRIGCELINPKIILITIFNRQDDYKSFP